MRARLKHIAERVLVESGAARFSRLRLRGSVIVLAYHNVVPDGEPLAGERSLHLPVADFSRQLDAITETHDVVPIGAVFTEAREAARPRAVITFDDAYLGAVTAGVRELASRSLPATIFVAPGLLGRVTWWDSIADTHSGAIDARKRELALTVLGGDTDLVMSEPENQVSNPNALPRICAESDLQAAAKHDGITLASHTWSHPNLVTLSDGDLRNEMEQPLSWLRDRFSCTIPWISYPYGKSDNRVMEAARIAGYAGGFRIDGGHIAAADAAAAKFALGRLNVPSGVSIDGFRLRLDGMGAGR